jgi:hypothetical protein
MSKRKRTASEESGEGDSIPPSTSNAMENNSLIFLPPEHESENESESEETEVDDLSEAALHTIWDVESAKDILSKIANTPKLTVFAAIRSNWGTGLAMQEAAKAHMDGMYKSGYCEPTSDGGILCMLRGTRDLASKLLQAEEFAAAFFFAHEAAAMIRRCEKEAARDHKEEADEWIKALDTVMAGAVKGWRAQSGDGEVQKEDAAILVELLEEGETTKGYDQERWYPRTLETLKAWAN